MRIFIVMLLALALNGGAVAQTNRGVRRAPTVTGEYEDTAGGGLTFNIERDNRARRYRLWIGSIGTSPMNYHEADAAELRLNDRTGTLSFSYTYANGPRCSFAGRVRRERITGELTCAGNGPTETRRVTLRRFRAASGS